MALPRQAEGPGTPEKMVAEMGRLGPSVLLPVGSPLMVTWPGVSSVMSTPAGRFSRARVWVGEKGRRKRRREKWCCCRSIVWAAALLEGLLCALSVESWVLNPVILLQARASKSHLMSSLPDH